MPDRSNDEPTFATLIDQLTIEHHGWVQRDAGTTLMTKTGLLQQLREAVFSGMEGTGGSSAFGSKLPMDAAAEDLLNEITIQASKVLAAMTHSPTPYGHAETYVQQWSELTEPHRFFTISTRTTDHGITELEAHALKLTRVFDRTEQLSAVAIAARWVARITEFFDPPSNAEIKAPCPSCDVQYLYKTKDGETVKSPAFNFIRDRETNVTLEARCSNCGASWSPDRFGWLAEHVGAKADTIKG